MISTSKSYCEVGRIAPSFGNLAILATLVGTLLGVGPTGSSAAAAGAAPGVIVDGVDSAGWMGAIAPRIATKALSEIAIPGTHDSGSYPALETNLAFADFSITQNLLKAEAAWNETLAKADFLRVVGLGLGPNPFTPIIPMVRSNVAKWGEAQDLDVGGQLEHGARFLDLRPCRNAANEIAFCHKTGGVGVTGPTLDQVLTQMKEFITTDGNRDEVVLAYFSHFDHVTFTSVQQMLLRQFNGGRADSPLTANAPDSGDLLLLPACPADYTKTRSDSGSYQVAIVGGRVQHANYKTGGKYAPLQVMVTNDSGVPAPGVKVRFEVRPDRRTTPGGHQSATFEANGTTSFEATTDNFGMATSDELIPNQDQLIDGTNVIIPNSAVGYFTVEAKAGSASEGVHFLLGNSATDEFPAPPCSTRWGAGPSGPDNCSGPPASRPGDCPQDYDAGRRLGTLSMAEIWASSGRIVPIFDYQTSQPPGAYWKAKQQAGDVPGGNDNYESSGANSIDVPLIIRTAANYLRDPAPSAYSAVRIFGATRTPDIDLIIPAAVSDTIGTDAAAVIDGAMTALNGAISVVNAAISVYNALGGSASPIEHVSFSIPSTPPGMSLRTLAEEGNPQILPVAFATNIGGSPKVPNVVALDFFEGNDNEALRRALFVNGVGTAGPSPVAVIGPHWEFDRGVPVESMTFDPTYYGLPAGISPTTPAICTTTATSASEPGDYPVNCSGAALDGYAFFYAPGVLTIRWAPTVPVTPGEIQIVVQPADHTVKPGETATFTAAGALAGQLAGGAAPTVEWQEIVAGGDTWSVVPGTTSTTANELVPWSARPVPVTRSTLSFTAARAQNGNFYRAVFRSGNKNAGTGAVRVFVYEPAPVVTENPSSQIVSVGGVARFEAKAKVDEIVPAGFYPFPDWKWQLSSDGQTWTDASESFSGQPAPLGTTTATLLWDAIPANNGLKFRAVFTNDFGSAVTDPATLTVPFQTIQFTSAAPAGPQGVGGTYAPTATGGNSGNPVVFTIDAASTSVCSLSAGVVTLTSAPNGRGLCVINANQAGNAVYPPAPQVQQTVIVVNVPPVITVHPTSQTVHDGDPVTFFADASGSALTVYWERSIPGHNYWEVLPGENSNTLSLTADASQSGYGYRAQFVNAADLAHINRATTDTAFLTVIATTPILTLHPVDRGPITDCCGLALMNNGSFTASATGNPTPTVQWQISTDGGMHFVDVQGGTNYNLVNGGEISSTHVFTANKSQNGHQYRAKFSNSGGSVYSDPATLIVWFPPAITAQPLDASRDEGQTAIFTAGASGFPVPSVKWQVSVDGGGFTDVPGATSPMLTLPALTPDMNGNRYRAVFTNEVFNFATRQNFTSATTGAALLTVVAMPTMTATPTATATLTATPTPTTAPPLACYRAAALRQTFTAHAVSVVDDFGTTHGVVQRPNGFCSPADMTGNDPWAPTSPASVVEYPLAARPQRLSRHTVSNEFGVQTLAVYGSGHLLVPSTQGLGSLPAAAIAPAGDHFSCYSARLTDGPRQGPRQTVTIQDLFGSYAGEVRRPTRLCLPAEVNGSSADADINATALLCYRMHPVRTVRIGKVFTVDEFGRAILVPRLLPELCVPSALL